MENSPDKFIGTFIAVLVVVMLATAHLWGVVETSEARYAEISREMYRSGDWLHPTLLSIHHYHKPPVTYWLTAASYFVFGVNLFATRILLTFSFALQVWLVFRIARQLFPNPHVACYSALVYATLPIVLVSARGLTTDSYLATFVALAIYCWIVFRTSGKMAFLFGCSAALGLGFLTKGPVALLVPGLIMVGSRYTAENARTQAGMRYTLAAILLFLIVGLSWFVILVVENPLFADYFFFHHFVDRVVHAEVFTRKEPWYYYLLILPIVFLPWVPFFIAGIYNKRARTAGSKLSVVHIAIWWFLLPLIAFSLFSSKLVLYILPLSIGFSLITGYSISQGVARAPVATFTSLIILIYLGLIAAPFAASNFVVNPVVQLIPVAALLATLAAATFPAKRERRIIASASMFGITLILFSSAVMRRNGIEVNTLEPVSSFLAENNLRTRNIVVYDQLLPSLAFELDKETISIYGGNKYLRRETQFENNDEWKDSLIDASNDGSLQKIDSLLSDSTVLIVKNELPLQLKAHMNRSWNKKQFGKWLVYYN
jgi:4-amino-4-deoxy-L-arabinose transferase-like glycosyltransferase